MIRYIGHGTDALQPTHFSTGVNVNFRTKVSKTALTNAKKRSRNASGEEKQLLEELVEVSSKVFYEELIRDLYKIYLNSKLPRALRDEMAKLGNGDVQQAPEEFRDLITEWRENGPPHIFNALEIAEKNDSISDDDRANLRKAVDDVLRIWKGIMSDGIIPNKVINNMYSKDEPAKFLLEEMKRRLQSKNISTEQYKLFKSKIVDLRKAYAAACKIVIKIIPSPGSDKNKLKGITYYKSIKYERLEELKQQLEKMDAANKARPASEKQTLPPSSSPSSAAAAEEEDDDDTVEGETILFQPRGTRASHYFQSSSQCASCGKQIATMVMY